MRTGMKGGGGRDCPVTTSRLSVILSPEDSVHISIVIHSQSHTDETLLWIPGGRETSGHRIQEELVCQEQGIRVGGNSKLQQIRADNVSKVLPCTVLMPFKVHPLHTCYRSEFNTSKHSRGSKQHAEEIICLRTHGPMGSDMLRTKCFTHEKEKFTF